MEFQISVARVGLIPFVIMMVLLCSSLAAQENLVVNGSFENIDSCEINYGVVNLGEGWIPFFAASTPDLFNECATESGLSVPENNRGIQVAFNGTGYAGFNPSVISIGISESVLGTLEDSLTKDSLYHVSFHLSLADRWQKAMRDIGLVFLDSMYTVNADSFYTIQPDLVETDWVTDKQGWHEVDTIYKAHGGETHLAIGYFPDENIYEALPGQGGDVNSTYYYVDNVSVIPYSVWLEASESHTEKVSLSVYPNPSTGVFNLEFSNPSQLNKPCRLTVTDIMGKQVASHIMTSMDYKLNLSDLNNGPYFLHVSTEDGTETWNFKLLLMR